MCTEIRDISAGLTRAALINFSLGKSGLRGEMNYPRIYIYLVYSSEFPVWDRRACQLKSRLTTAAVLQIQPTSIFKSWGWRLAPLLIDHAQREAPLTFGLLRSSAITTSRSEALTRPCRSSDYSSPENTYISPASPPKIPRS